jgi:hypothetical protein
MPQTINILVDVDSVTTLNTGSPRLIMVDDNPSDGGQGTSSLTVNANIDDTLNWYVISLQPGFHIAVTGIQPTASTPPFTPFVNGDSVWSAQVVQPGNSGYTYAYTIYGETGANLGSFTGSLTVNVP